jgi:N-acetylmuramoyl-L-alanine amidase
MHRAVVTFFALGTAAAVSGCVAPIAPRRIPHSVGWDSASDATQQHDVPVALSSTDDVRFYDLIETYHLQVALDVNTGRRVCSDETNEVVVLPGAEVLEINGADHALSGRIAWRDGVLFLPRDSISVLAEHLRLPPVQAVTHRPGQFDGSEAHLVTWHASAAPASAPRPARTSGLPQNWDVPGDRPWRSIVIHHSATDAGGAEAFGREHQKKWPNGLGYHFVIGNGTHTADGAIEVGPRWLRQNDGIHGAHAGNRRYNEFGIGICIVGEFNQSGPTEAQLIALRHLCRALMARHRIPRDEVFRHQDVRRGHTDCPGSNFPFAEFVRGL